MMNNDEEILADLLLDWEEQYEKGQDVSALEMCRQSPHLANELARRITALKIFSWHDKPVEIPASNADTPRPSNDEPRILAGRYRLDEMIAEGGFAQVWKGFDMELQRTVAIKMPKPNRVGSVEAFLAEARKVAKLKHPGIVPIFDTAGCATQVKREGTCFLVSEYVEGGSLADLIQHRRPDSALAARYVAEVAEALQYAHLQGFVHRDIKPGNILLDHHGRALLTDFGIAVTAEETGGQIIGTLRYMSPEQLDGKGVDARSDIYSLGVLLHELVTGNLPYSSVEPNVLRREIAAGTMIVSPSMPAELRRICLKALELDLEIRYVSAAELATDLRRAFESHFDGSSSAQRAISDRA